MHVARSIGRGWRRGTKGGVRIDDPKQLFNSSLEGKTRRAIDIRQGEKLNEAAFKQLIRAAVAANAAVRTQRAAKKK